MAAIGSLPAIAQQELMLSQMTRSWQFNSINPAAFPENKRVAIGLPGIGIDAYHSGQITYRDLLTESNGQTLIDFDQVIQHLEDENDLTYRQRIESFSLGLRLPGPGKTALSIGHSIRIHSNTTYQRELLQLMWQGNAQFIGQTVEIAPTTYTHDWHDIELGVSRSFGKFRVGVKGRYLMGISSIITDESARSFSVYTNPDVYQLEMTSNYGFYSAGFISSIDTSGLGFNVTANELSGKVQNGSNGMAFDLGFTAELTKRLTVYASALDLGGSIRWKEANYFRSQGNFTYNGATLPGADLINGETDLDFSGKLDSLNDIFQFQKSEASDFSTDLPQRYYAGATYELNKRLKGGVSFFHENYKEAKQTAMGISVQVRPLKWIELGAMYIANRQERANFGFQIGLHPGWGHFFIASDHIPGALKPLESPRVNLRTGLSLVF